MKYWFAGLAVATMATSPLSAQGSPASRTEVIGPQYRAGALHRFLFGGYYRNLWTTPVRIPVLDLATFAGGLTPVKEGGGQQTHSLRLLGADGRQYAFRSVDKDPAGSLPPLLRQTALAGVLRDQTSAAHPAAPLVVAPLLQATGVLHATPQLVLMPDDPALGEFRARFAGMIGMIEVRPDEANDGGPSFAGADKVVGTERFLELIEDAGSDRVDVTSYLAARLMDIFFGDWDRHVGQWRWALVAHDADPVWLPVPSDRDQAFSKLDGLLPSLAVRVVPQLVSFGPDYPAVDQITWSGRVLDRRLLPALEWPAWDSVAAAVQASLTDSAIAESVQRLPAEYIPLDAEWLARMLRSRRDQLPGMARRFYRMLAAEVDVHLTDGAEQVRVLRPDERSVTVEARRRSGEVSFRRRFDAADTKDVRLYLHGSADVVTVTGPGDSPITLRVIGGGGRDTLADSSRARGVHFYDGPHSVATRGWQPALDSRPHPAPQSHGSAGAPRDFGSLLLGRPWVMLVADVGLFAGADATQTRYGFGKTPFARQVKARVGYAAGADALLGEASVTWREVHANRGVRVAGRASGLELLHFYGYGNETVGGPRAHFAVRQQQYRLDASVEQGLAPGWTASAGPTLGLTTTDLPAGSFIAAARPYGIGTIGQVGLRGRVEADTRDRPAAPSRGYHLRFEGNLYPGVWDLRSGYAEIHGVASVAQTLPVPTHPVLALKVGGKQVWGDAPLHDAAFLGGVTTVRGYAEQRFAGDASAYGSAELRVPIGKFFFVLPGDFGIYGIAEGGRVWREGESSDAWHGASGGGVWFAFLDRAATVTATAVRSPERTAFYLRAGFGW